MRDRRLQAGRLSARDLEALRGASAEGAAMAGQAIAQLTGLDLCLSVHRVRELRLDQVPESLGGPETLVVAVHLKIVGECRGEILIVIDPVSAGRLLAAVLPAEPPSIESLSEMQESALLELGNVLAGAYLNALGIRAGRKLLPSVPELAIDMAAAVVDNLLVETTRGQPAALVVETDLAAHGHPPGPVGGRILLLPDPGTLPDMLEAILGRDGGAQGA